MEKLTDNEIKKALECCVVGTSEACLKCEFRLTPYPVCKTLVEKEALNLINRQQAEIEKLTADLKTAENVIKNTFLEKAGFDIDPLVEIKAEAIKEFADRLKKMYANNKTSITSLVTLYDNINNLVKELVGE